MLHSRHKYVERGFANEDFPGPTQEPLKAQPAPAPHNRKVVSAVDQRVAGDPLLITQPRKPAPCFATKKPALPRRYRSCGLPNREHNPVRTTTSLQRAAPGVRQANACKAQEETEEWPPSR